MRNFVLVIIPKSYVMNKSLLRNVLLGITALLIYSSANSQYAAMVSEREHKAETQKRIDDYLELFKLGYTEREIFEDLGNVNFLIENYDTAVFWYEKLLDLADGEHIPESYYERYQFAMHKAGLVESRSDFEEKDWMAMIREDYQMNTSNPRQELAQNRPKTESSVTITAHSYALPTAEVLAYNPPITVTADGQTAYFTKAIKIKPLYGMFSKKQTVYKIFKAENVNGQWKRIKEVAVCPKYASAMHPAVSQDGKRLFFASNMPGTFGKYDIYVSEIKADGSMGVAKNLGEKVNTEKNDLYPNLIDNSMLTFASDGRKGQGGLDLYAVKVGRSKLSLAVNLGSPFNSNSDDYSLALNKGKGVGYVMSNRGGKESAVQQIAFTYNEDANLAETAIAEDEFLEILNSNLNSGYSNTVYDDPEP